MFREKGPQLSMFESYHYLPEAKQQRLKNSWPHVFRTEVMPMIPKDEFKHLYCEDNGRPNEPASILVALSVIKKDGRSFSVCSRDNTLIFFMFVAKHIHLDGLSI